MHNFKKLLWIGLAFCFFITNVQAAQFFPFYFNPWNATSGYDKIENGGFQPALGVETIDGITGLYMNYTDANSAGGREFFTHYETQLLFDKLLNQSYLNLLNADSIEINFSARAHTLGMCVGGGCEANQIVMPLDQLSGSGSRIFLHFLEKGAEDLLNITCGTNSTAIYTSYDTAWYNISLVMNYTSNETLVYASHADGSNPVSTICGDTFFQTTGNFNNTPTVLDTPGGTNPGISASNLIISADFDQNYGNSANPYTTVLQYITDEDSVNINFTSPIVVNASAEVGGTVTTICTNCQFAELNVSVASVGGIVPIYLNYSFDVSGGDTFTKVENYTVTKSIPLGECGSIVDSPVMNITFREEDARDVDISSNMTLVLTSSIDGTPIIDTTKTEVTSFSLCGNGDPSNFPVNMRLSYFAGNYTLRELNFQNLSLNISMPINITAYHIIATEVSTVLVTLLENIGIPLEGYIIEAYKQGASGIGIEPILTSSYETSPTGVTTFLIDLNEVGTKYRFIVLKDGVVYKDLGYETQVSTTKTITITTSTNDVIQTQENINNNLNYSFSFNQVDNVTVQWTGISAVVNSVCLRVEGSNLTTNFVSDTCYTTDSSSVVFTLPDRNIPYTATFYALAGNDLLKYPVDIINIPKSTVPAYTLFGADALFWMLILIMIAAFAIYYSPSGMILIPVIIFDLVVLAGWINIAMVYMWSITGMSLIWVWALERGR